jgi:uncharacterized protein
MRLAVLLFATFVLSSALAAQTGSIQASGSATVGVTPDLATFQATFTIGVTTQGSTAQEASTLNATQTTAMIAALTAAVGKNGTVQTISYSVNPRYATTGTQSTIAGYTANNTVQVTTTDLPRLGAIIDAGTQAGGTNVGGVSFSIEKPDPFVQQALSLAAKQAVAHAAAIAAGLGAKTGNVLSAQEGSTVVPYRADTLAGAATTTPIQIGAVSVSAYVTVSVQLVQ